MEIEVYYELCPVPAVCEECRDTDCYVCDHFGERWRMSERYELFNKRKSCEQAIARYQREVRKIDLRLAVLNYAEAWKEKGESLK